MRHLMLFVLLAGCATGPRGYRDGSVPEVLVVSEEEAARLELEPRFLERTFDDGRDSTGVIRSFLEDVRDEGSGHVRRSRST